MTNKDYRPQVYNECNAIAESVSSSGTRPDESMEYGPQLTEYWLFRTKDGGWHVTSDESAVDEIIMAGHKFLGMCEAQTRDDAMQSAWELHH